MTADGVEPVDPRAARDLDALLDAVVQGEPGNRGDAARFTEPGLVETARRFHALAQEPDASAPSPAVLASIWEDLMAQPQASHSVPLAIGVVAPASGTMPLEWQAPSSPPAPRRRLRWPVTEVAVAAVILLTLATGYALQGGMTTAPPEREASAPAVAQLATPVATSDVPDASECRIEPRPLDDLIALFDLPEHDAAAGRDATPLAIPSGTPASDVVVAGVTATVREYYACINAEDPRRRFALFTDDALRRFADRFGAPAAADLAVSGPRPLRADERFFPRTIRDVRVLEDGRVSAIVIESNLPLEAQGQSSDAFLPATAFLFAERDGRYLIDDIIVPVDADGTPAP